MSPRNASDPLYLLVPTVADYSVSQHSGNPDKAACQHPFSALQWVGAISCSREWIQISCLRWKNMSRRALTKCPQSKENPESRGAGSPNTQASFLPPVSERFNSLFRGADTASHVFKILAFHNTNISSMLSIRAQCRAHGVVKYYCTNSV